MPVGLFPSQAGRVTESSPHSYTENSCELRALQLTGGHKDTRFRDWCWSKNLLLGLDQLPEVLWLSEMAFTYEAVQHLFIELFKYNINEPKSIFVFPNTSGTILQALHSTKASERWCNSWRNRCYLVPHFTPDSSWGHCRSQGPQRLRSEQDKPLSPVSVQEHSSPAGWQRVRKKTTRKQGAMDLTYISQQIKCRMLQESWLEGSSCPFLLPRNGHLRCITG